MHTYGGDPCHVGGLVCRKKNSTFAVLLSWYSSLSSSKGVQEYIHTSHGQRLGLKMKQKQIKIPYFLFVQLPYYSNLPISINILFLAAPIHRHHHQKADQKVLRPCSNSNLLPATGTYQQPRPLCTPHSRGGGKPGSHIKKAAWLNMAGQARGRMAEHGRPGASMAEHGRPGASMAEHGRPGACFPLSQSLILSRAVRTPSRSTV